MLENVIQIINGITINLGASEKILKNLQLQIICAKCVQKNYYI